MKPFGAAGCLFLCIWLGAIHAPAQERNPFFASIAGKVRDESGKPLGAAIVRLEQDGWEIVRTNTSPTGEYQLTLKPTDKPYSLLAKQIDFLPARTNLTIRAGGQVKADFLLRDDSSIVGRVLALDNSPLRDVVVQAIRLDTNYSANASPDLAGAPLEPGLMGEYFQAESPRVRDWARPGVSGWAPAGSLLSPTLRRVDRDINFKSAPGGFAGTELDQKQAH